MGVKNNHNNTVKFVCSYGGKILPRKKHGDLRYVGGLNRILAVDRSIAFSGTSFSLTYFFSLHIDSFGALRSVHTAELMEKLEEFCGFSVTLRSQLPNGDLETLVSIRSDEELASLVEEYDQASRKSSSCPPLKIRAVLTPPAPSASLKVVVSPPPSSGSSADISPYQSPRLSSQKSCDCRSCSPPVVSPVGPRNLSPKFHCFPWYGGPGQSDRVLCRASPRFSRCQ